MKKVDIDLFSETDVAIVGLGLRVPGAQTPAAFWDNLRAGRESVRHYSDEELCEAGESEERLRRPNYVRAGAPLEDMDHFDGDFFGFSPKECGILDPQHRQFMMTAWEALEDAAHPPETLEGRVGVFAGCGMGSYFYFNLCQNRELLDSVGMFLLRHTGNDKDFLATRVSFLFNLTGPAINVQTACSTSLVATHLACQSLLSGECDVALAGGVTIDLPHRRGYLYQENEVLSPDGHCHAFDHRGQGTVFGSGAGVAVLRRLRDAVLDGDHIYAVIKGSAVNNDGAQKAGYLAPSVDGQAAAMMEAIGISGVEADDIDYVECHGTGTYLGDPIEVSALTSAFGAGSGRARKCRIGSVKTNIGHLDTAAGVASLAKTALALRAGEMPPSINFEKPNPAIDFENSPFVVNQQLRAWEAEERPRRAAVNSLGVGGTNAFAVLEQAPALPPSDEPAGAAQVLLLSARSRQALEASCDRLAARLQADRELKLADVAHTLWRGRRRFRHRCVLAAESLEEAAALLKQRDPRRVFFLSEAAQEPSVVFLFPGGGAQYPQMAKCLYESESVFRQQVDEGLHHLDEIADFDLRETLFARDEDLAAAKERFTTPSIQLPALFIIECALAKLWISKGINPQSLLGHSLGENSAACVAGVLSFKDGVGLTHLRGKLMDGVEPGGLTSVSLSANKLRHELVEGLDIACVNAPELCVVSGPIEPLRRLEEKLAADDVDFQRLAVNVPAHSSLLDPILERFGDYLRSIELSRPAIPFVSNRTGTWITDEQATSPDYWVEHLRRTVHFEQGVRTLAEDKDRIYLEVGPGKVLGSLARQNPTVVPYSVLASLRHPEQAVDDRLMMLSALGQLHALGVDVDETLFFPEAERRLRVSLPTYPFQTQRYWIEPSRTAVPLEVVAEPRRTEEVQDWFYYPVWRRHDAEPQARGQSQQCWLVFVDEYGVGRGLAARLRARGDTVISVQDGDAFVERSSTEYQISLQQGRETFGELVRAVLKGGHQPTRVVVAWLLAREESFRPGSSFLHRNQERGFYTLTYLVQALAEEEYSNSVHITAVSSGIHSVQGEAVPYPAQATLLGPCRVVPREFPGFTCAAVDVRLSMRKTKSDLRSLLRAPAGGKLELPPAELATLLDCLEAELLSEPSNRTVALRGDTRWLQSQRPRRGTEPAGACRFKRNGVYLMTGGFGGISYTIASHLAERYQAKLVLICRTPVPERVGWSEWLDKHPHDEIAERIRKARELEALGAEVMVASCDVADSERVAEIVADATERFGRLNGVVHAAGVVNDGLISTKRPAEVEAVFAPKIYGTLALDAALKTQNLDFWLLFSSTSTTIAPAGQVDYVAANAFLNAFAQARAPGVQAVNWGIWSDVGMAEQTAERLGLAERPWVPTLGEYPLFDEQRRLAKGLDLRGSLSTSKHWLLDEHRTKQGQALVPGTGFVELARAALREWGESGPFEIKQLLFLCPLHVLDDEAKPVRVRLSREEDGVRFVVQSERVLDDGRKGWEHHAEATLLLHSSKRPGPLRISEIQSCCRVSSEVDADARLRTRQEDHLRFGPRWRVLCERHYGAGQALGKLRIAEPFLGDLEAFGLHPALLDLATGCAMRLIAGYAASDNLWVPISYGSVTVWADLPRVIYSWVRNCGENSVEREFAKFDITITDEAGRVLMEVQEFTIKKLVYAKFLTVPKPNASELVFDDVAAKELSPAEAAFVHNLGQGITPNEGVRALELLLSDKPSSVVTVSSMALSELAAQASNAARPQEASDAKFSRPNLDSEYTPPQDAVERSLVAIWEDLLGVDKLGTKDSFFEVGGHSLIAVRVFSKVKKLYGVEFPISVLFEAPTIERLAKLVKQATGFSGEEEGASPSTGEQNATKRRFDYVVPMHTGRPGNGSPFFLVAGMFGNVLNLRHLANLIGSDRPLYGLQARGLLGDCDPHETFEETATDYIREMKHVQPEGPYLVGGFSGGGITAFEIAKQLLAEGDEVGLLVLLDTFLPKDEPITRRDKLTMHAQRLQVQGAGYVVNWLKKKLHYRSQVKQQQQLLEKQSKGSPTDFRSQVVEAAHYRAVDRYALTKLPIAAALFRPKPRVMHQLGPGRAVNKDLRFVLPDNGWTPWVETLGVYPMPGDHDSMVLEPNVRVLISRLRELLRDADRTPDEEPGSGVRRLTTDGSNSAPRIRTRRSQASRGSGSRQPRKGER